MTNDATTREMADALHDHFEGRYESLSDAEMDSIAFMRRLLKNVASARRRAARDEQGIAPEESTAAVKAGKDDVRDALGRKPWRGSFDGHKFVARHYCDDGTIALISDSLDGLAGLTKRVDLTNSGEVS